METFFDDEDYEVYMSLMKEWCQSSGIKVWAYCLMINRVHLIVERNQPEGPKNRCFALAFRTLLKALYALRQSLRRNLM